MAKLSIQDSDKIMSKAYKKFDKTIAEQKKPYHGKVKENRYGMVGGKVKAIKKTLDKAKK